ncbi:unnamed protein product [Ectocarpus sp. 6 AP-2014]
MSNAPSVVRSGVLIVWDFDWSLVNENSDTWVIKQLGQELMPEFRRLREEENLGWTQIMNRQMRSLWKKGVSESEIKWSMSRLPVFQRMLDAVCLAGRGGAQQAVVSDANTVFIEEFLKHHGIRGLFGKGISTNGGVFTEDGRLDVQPYHTNQAAPHGCRLCPPNMCKGSIVEGLLAAPDGGEDRAFDRVIYIGDGGGDYCPALRLRPGDLLLARDGGEGGRKFGLRERIEKEEGGPMACRVVPWQKGEDVYSAFESELVGGREMAA